MRPFRQRLVWRQTCSAGTHDFIHSRTHIERGQELPLTATTELQYQCAFIDQILFAFNYSDLAGDILALHAVNGLLHNL